MECPKGLPCVESTHSVKTLAKAAEWYPAISASDMPIRIEQRIGEGGRVLAKIYSCSGQLIHKRG